MHRVVGAVAILAALVGCTHRQLRQKTAGQVRTLSDIYQQQVLDNLALFAYDAEALPYFARASQGTATISGQASLSLGNFLQRQTQEAWQLTPIDDPRKLQLMRCAYQRVIAMQRAQPMRADCPNCARVFNNFYTGDPDVAVEHRDQGGAVTINCLDGPKWLCIGCEKCAAKRSKPGVGRYGAVRVWALPGGSDELSKLTLMILDYAVHEPPAKQTKTVAFHLAKDGALTTADKSFADVSGPVAADAASDTLMTLPYTAALEHICSRNNYGLTVAALRAIDPRTLAEPDGGMDLRSRYRITNDQSQQIRELVTKLKDHQVDSADSGAEESD